MRLCALSASSFKYFLAHTPVEGDGRHGVNAGKYGCDGEKVVEAAVARAEVPLVVNGVGEVDDRVERRHAGFSKGQVHLQGGVDGGGMKVICASMSHNTCFHSRGIFICGGRQCFQHSC